MIQLEDRWINPIKALDTVKDSCINIFNTIEDSVLNGKNIKDEILKQGNSTQLQN